MGGDPYSVISNNSRVLGQVIIQVTNSLDNGSLDLTVTCPNIEPKSYLLHPGGYHQWFPGATTQSPFLCSFQWKGASHMFNIYDPTTRDKDCEECHWYVKETGPCRLCNLPNTPRICSKWN